MNRINYLEEYHCAYHRIKDNKTFTMFDMRSLSNLGLPIIKELSELYKKRKHNTITVDEVCNRIYKGKVSYKDVLSILDDSYTIRRIWRDNVWEY